MAPAASRSLAKDSAPTAKRLEEVVPELEPLGSQNAALQEELQSQQHWSSESKIFQADA